ncbi:MAG: ABC transporter ATP-binding protein/permease [Caulobacterales bacterium]
MSPSVPAAMGKIIALVGGLKDREIQLRLWASLLLTLGGKVIAVGAPLVLAHAINKLAASDLSGLPPLFVGLVMLWAGLRFGSTALPQIRDAIFAPVSQEAQRRAGAKVFTHVHALSVRYHQSKRTGSLFRTIERGIRSIDFLLRFLGFNIGPTLLELALAAAVLAVVYGWQFSLVAAVTIGVYAWITLTITEWRIEHRRDMNAADNEATGRAVDSLLNFETVKSFGAEKRETERYDGALAHYAHAAIRANSSLVLLNIIQGVITSLGLVAMIVLAGTQIAAGQMGPGDITAVILYMMNIYQPLNMLGMAYREIKQSAIDVEKMFALLDEKPDIADAPGAAPLVAKTADVNFDHVTFAHEARTAGLTDVTFTAEAGKTTAIVGPSGAGKSTILKLLYRFYDPSGGRITIDGADIRGVTQESLRAHLGLVPQDVVLFNDTLRYNISYANPDASQAQLDEAAQRGQLSDFIAKLPNGWDTKVGERGLKLSGGEKQRVGIARVILKDPRILVLDEATSSLDSLTEAEVQAALDEASRGRTTIVVAHRLSTIAAADKIVVIKEGRIVEQGAHHELLAHGGEYAELWRIQAENPFDIAAE